MSGRQGKGQRPARIGKQGKTTDSDAKKAEKQESPVQFSVSMICSSGTLHSYLQRAGVRNSNRLDGTDIACWGSSSSRSVRH
jgi:hypothetical protein